MHASQIQGCVVEQRAEKKRKIAESVWVHNVVTVRTGKVAGQCAMPVSSLSLFLCTDCKMYISERDIFFIVYLFAIFICLYQCNFIYRSF